MTTIEWTNKTWNPVTGCTKVSPGCKNCYAERLAPKVFAGQMMPPDPIPGYLTRPRKFTDVLTHPDRLDAPLRWRKPQRVFVNSMSDLFHEDVAETFIWSTLAIAALTPRHSYQILTKRPERMRAMLDHDEEDALNVLCGALGQMLDGDWVWQEGKRFRPAIEQAISRCLGVDHDENDEERLVETLSWPLPNVWLGVSVEDQATADERIPLLLQTPAAIRFVSYEPALGPVDFNYTLARYWASKGALVAPVNYPNGRPRVDWLIAGGESGPNARPAHPDWFRSARDQCAAAGVAFFFKQWGEWAPICDYYSESYDRDTYADRCTANGRWRLVTQQGHTWVVGTPGTRERHDGQPPPGTWILLRAGKRNADRLLDGREHSEYPA